MVMKDPRPVQTGLSLRLKTAIVTPVGTEELGWDWKDAHDYDVHGMLNEDQLLTFGDIYDQSQRRPYARPTSLCALSWSSFLASEEMLLKGNAAAVRALEVVVRDIRTKLYAMVESHGVPPLADPPWELEIPALPVAQLVAEDAVEEDGPDEETAAITVDMEKDDDLDDLLPLSTEPPTKKARQDLSESL